MLTFDDVLRKIRGNFPKEAHSPQVEWVRESASSIVTTDNAFRITRKMVDCKMVYEAERCATANSSGKPIGGQFVSAEQAKEACAFWVMP
jgi:hypothetical protein